MSTRVFHLINPLLPERHKTLWTAAHRLGPRKAGGWRLGNIIVSIITPHVHADHSTAATMRPKHPKSTGEPLSSVADCSRITREGFHGGLSGPSKLADSFAQQFWAPMQVVMWYRPVLPECLQLVRPPPCQLYTMTCAEPLVCWRSHAPHPAVRGSHHVSFACPTEVPQLPREIGPRIDTFSCSCKTSCSTLRRCCPPLSFRRVGPGKRQPCASCAQS